MIYGHSQDLAAAMPLIRQRRPPYWKAIDPDMNSAHECAALGVKLIVRHHGPWDQSANAFNAVQFYRSASAQPWFPFAWAVETPNEPFSGQDVPSWYVAEEAALVTLLRNAGKECVVCNRGTGHDGHYVPGARFYGKKWFLIKPPYHLFYFDRASASRILHASSVFSLRISS